MTDESTRWESRTTRAQKPGVESTGPSVRDPGSRVGQVVGRYRILSELGRGGMGVVWKAEDLQIGRAVALKFLPAERAHSASARRRFLREARAAAKLDHPAIATVYHPGEHEGEHYIALSYVDGGTLSERTRSGPLRIEEAVRIALAVGDALRHAHGRGVIHRDVTNRNVMIARDGRVMVVDFGLASVAGESALSTRSRGMGTVGFVAPEVLEGKAGDHRSDLFALGVVLYQALGGRRPFEAEREEVELLATVREEPSPPSRWNPRISPELDAFVLRSLAKDPQDRLQSADEFCRELQRVAPSVRLPDDWLGVAPSVLTPRREGERLVVAPFQGADLSESDAGLPSEQISGLADALCAALTSVSELEVIPPSDLASQTESAASLADRYAADYVLQGSVRRFGDEMRIVFHLMEPGESRQLDAGTVTGSARDLFSLEDRFVREVMQVLRRHLTAQVDAFRRITARAGGDHDRFLQAMGYLKHFDNEASVDGAIQILEQLLRDTGEATPYRAALARAQLHKFELTSELEWLARAAENSNWAVAEDAHSPEALVTQGQVWIATGALEEAVRSLHRALDLRPHYPEALLALASAHAERGEATEAEEACREAIRLRPSWWQGYNLLGKLLWKQGRFGAAVGPWRMVTRLAPDSARGHMNLGSAYFRLDRLEDAERCYRLSLDLFPTPGAWGSLGSVLFYRGRFAEAAEAFEKSIALRPADPKAWGNLGVSAHFIPGRETVRDQALDRAIDLARARLDRNPQSAVDWAQVAGWLSLRGRLEEARSAIEHALRLGPSDVSVLFSAAGVHLDLGERDEALRWLGEAVAKGYSLAAVRRDPYLGVLVEDTAFERLVAARALEHVEAEEGEFRPASA